MRRSSVEGGVEHLLFRSLASLGSPLIDLRRPLADVSAATLSSFHASCGVGSQPWRRDVYTSGVMSHTLWMSVHPENASRNEFLRVGSECLTRWSPTVIGIASPHSASSVRYGSDLTRTQIPGCPIPQDDRRVKLTMQALTGGIDIHYSTYVRLIIVEI